MDQEQPALGRKGRSLPYSSTTNWRMPTFSQNFPKAVRDGQILMGSLRLRTGHHVALEAPYHVDTHSAALTQRRIAHKSFQGLLPVGFFHPCAPGDRGSLKFTPFFDRPSSLTEGWSLSLARFFEGASLSFANECRSTPQTKPQGAGTPKVVGLATATAADCSQERVRCGDQLNIAFVLRSPSLAYLGSAYRPLWVQAV